MRQPWRTRGQFRPHKRFSASSVVAASELPPPMPAPQGTCLSMWMSAPSAVPLACLQRSGPRAGTGRRRAARGRGRGAASRPSSRQLEVQRVGPVDQHEGRLQQVVAVGAAADDVQEEVELGGRGQVVQGMRAVGLHGAAGRSGPGRTNRRIQHHAAASRRRDCVAPRSRPSPWRAERSPASPAARSRLRLPHVRRARPGPPASQSGSAASGTSSPSASRDSSSSNPAKRRRPRTVSQHVTARAAQRALRPRWVPSGEIRRSSPLLACALQFEGGGDDFCASRLGLRLPSTAPASGRW